MTSAKTGITQIEAAEAGFRHIVGSPDPASASGRARDTASGPVAFEGHPSESVARELRIALLEEGASALGKVVRRRERLLRRDLLL